MAAFVRLGLPVLGPKARVSETLQHTLEHFMNTLKRLRRLLMIEALADEDPPGTPHVDRDAAR